MTSFLLLTATVVPASNATEPEVPPPPNVVLISLDTTRADALSCYGKPLPGLRVEAEHRTPVLDRLAEMGVRFEQFWALAPSTLNSHATMFTGLTPHEHAVPRNGGRLDPKFNTLAERLGEAGWDTIGVVGSAALEADLGINQGYRVWRDDVSELHGMMYEQRASGVVDRTLAALEDRDEKKPLFLFVHFNDAHAPYDPPPPFDSKFAEVGYKGFYAQDRTKTGVLQRALEEGSADPADVAYVAGLYQGEVTYVDAELGRLLGNLQELGLLERTLVVVTADHGEVLSEHPIFAYSHGTDISEGAMHIPLVVHGFGLPLARRAVVRQLAGLDGLAPTIERLVGLPATLGTDFYDMVRPGPVSDAEGWPESPSWIVRMEATRPIEHEYKQGWNNLRFYRGIRAGGWTVRSAPVFGIPLELSDASAVPEAERPIQAWLAEELARWDAAAPPYVPVETAPAQRRALIELGYLDPDEAPLPNE